MANRIVDLAAAQLYPEDAPHGYIPLAVEGDGYGGRLVSKLCTRVYHFY